MFWIRYQQVVSGVTALTKKLLVVERSRIPDDVRELWGEPTLLSSEDPQVYDKLARTVAQAIAPNDGIEWLWVNDVVALSWEIRRLRQFKTHLIELKRKETLGWEDDPKEKEKAREYWESEHGETELFLDNLEPWEKIDHLLAIAEARRVAVLREIERRRSSLASRLGKASSDIIDGEFDTISEASHESEKDNNVRPRKAVGEPRRGVARVQLKRTNAGGA